MISILIPAHNEEYLQNTINDILKHKEGDIEILVALDNWDAEIQGATAIKTNKGQRGATNELAKIAKGDVLVKCDAHCSFSYGFDNVLEDLAQRATIALPALCNLRVYDWICEDGHKRQSEQFETEAVCHCGKPLTKSTVWQPIPKPIMTNYYFDTNLHFQYSEDQDDENIETETMSAQGSCFAIKKEDYLKLNICDEAFGSWGQQGTEISAKAWLSGGNVISTRNAFYAHWFRGQKPAETEQILATQKKSRELFLNNAWEGQIRPIQWLIEKFNYPGDWSALKTKEICKAWQK